MCSSVLGCLSERITAFYKLHLFVSWLLKFPSNIQSESQGQVCLVTCFFCHSEMEVADQTLCFITTKLLAENISRVSGQNGVSLLYVMLEIHHSGREPSICWGHRQ